jgi:hypothetical protein
MARPGGGLRVARVDGHRWSRPRLRRERSGPLSLAEVVVRTWATVSGRPVAELVVRARGTVPGRPLTEAVVRTAARRFAELVVRTAATVPARRLAELAVPIGMLASASLARVPRPVAELAARGRTILECGVPPVRVAPWTALAAACVAPGSTAKLVSALTAGYAVATGRSVAARPGVTAGPVAE